MSVKSECECGCSCGCNRCAATLEHPRYFGGQVITAVELNLEHQYLYDKMRRHNRMLHGWGIVCGAKLQPVPAGENNGSPYLPWKVRVTPGYLLSPCGDEIYIDCPRVIDVRGPGMHGVCGQSGGDEDSDPWCSDVREDRREIRELFIAARYAPVKTRPVRTITGGCDCGGASCEYSRWRDGYEIAARPECGCCHGKETRYNAEWLGSESVMMRRIAFERCNDDWGITVPPALARPDCPPCPSDDWVYLGGVDIDECGVIRPKLCACCRTVVSFAHVHWKCPDEPVAM